MKMGTGKVKGRNTNLHSQKVIVYFSHLQNNNNKKTTNKQTKKTSISLIGQDLKVGEMSPLRISEDPFLEKEPKYTSWRIKTKWRAH